MHRIRQEPGTIGLQIQQHSRIKCACLSSSSELLVTLYQEHHNQRHSLHFHRYPSTAQHTSTTVRMRACVRTPAERDTYNSSTVTADCTRSAYRGAVVQGRVFVGTWSVVCCLYYKPSSPVNSSITKFVRTPMILILQ